MIGDGRPEHNTSRSEQLPYAALGAPSRAQCIVTTPRLDHPVVDIIVTIVNIVVVGCRPGLPPTCTTLAGRHGHPALGRFPLPVPGFFLFLALALALILKLLL